MKTYISILLVACVVLFTSCQKNINLKIPGYTPQIVVEGYIENGVQPVVQLTKSSPYFQPYTIDSFSAAYLHNAIVVVTDGNIKDTLTEFNSASIPPNLLPPYFRDSFKFYAYLDQKPTPKIVGQTGHTYTLDVYYNGMHAYSTTAIKQPLTIDSIWFVNGLNDTSQRHINVKSKDFPEIGDYYKYYLGQNLHLTGFAPFDDYFQYKQITIDFSTFSDQFFNADTFVLKTRYNYKRGDTAYVKMCHIDYAQYQFWTTLASSSGSQGSPFSSPVYVTSNITNGLGLWAGMGTVYKSIVINK